MEQNLCSRLIHDSNPDTKIRIWACIFSKLSSQMKSDFRKKKGTYFDMLDESQPFAEIDFVTQRNHPLGKKKIAQLRP